MIVVVNRRKEPHASGYYVGRPSPLGNPFRVGIDGSRREVIAKYREWLSFHIQDETSEQAREIIKLSRLAKRCRRNKTALVLVCWCKPLACHADVIKEKLEWLLNERT